MPDGLRLWVANDDSDTVTVIATDTNAVEATIAVGTEPQSIAFTPDGTGVWVAAQPPSLITVLNASTLAIVSTLSLGATTSAVAFRSC